MMMVVVDWGPSKSVPRRIERLGAYSIYSTIVVVVACLSLPLEERVVVGYPEEEVQIEAVFLERENINGREPLVCQRCRAKSSARSVARVVAYWRF